MTIRPADFADLGTLVALGEAMHQESRHRRFPFSPGKTRENLALLIASPDGCVLLAEKHGQAVGTFVGFIAETFFGPARIAYDQALFILPEHRGGSTAPRLIDAFKAWAASRQADDVMVGVTTGVHTEKTVALYEHKGFKPAGVLLAIGG